METKKQKKVFKTTQKVSKPKTYKLKKSFKIKPFPMGKIKKALEEDRKKEMEERIRISKLDMPPELFIPKFEHIDGICIDNPTLLSIKYHRLFYEEHPEYCGFMIDVSEPKTKKIEFKDFIKEFDIREYKNNEIIPLVRYNVDNYNYQITENTIVHITHNTLLNIYKKMRGQEMPKMYTSSEMILWLKKINTRKVFIKYCNKECGWPYEIYLLPLIQYLNANSTLFEIINYE